jgi:tetratricopeptide (TPR) repeat protein
VAIHRQLVGQDPSQRPKLAASLHNLGVVLIRLGRKEEAVAPTEEALALYRAMAVAHGREASSAMERPLRNLVLLYFEGNRPQEALPLADELVRLHQILSPQDPALQAEQVDVLNLRASLLVALNRPQEARLDLDAAVAKGRQLLKLDPQNPGLQYGLAGSLVNVSQVADLLGNWAQALKPALEAEALLRQLARSQPQLIGDWAKALSRLGQAYARGGEPAQARPPLEESIDLLRLLARSGPAETLTVEMGGYRDDLAHALESLAVVQQQLNRPQESRAAAVEAMELYRALATVDPRYGKDVERTRAWLSSLPQGTLMRP